MKKICFFLLFFCSGLHSSEYQFEGVHYIASFVDCDLNALCDFKSLERAVEDGIYASGASLLSMSKYEISKVAITMAFLLSESHASIHTYPECSSCYIDFFTCGTSCEYLPFHEVLVSYLNPKNVDVQIIWR